MSSAIGSIPASMRVPTEVGSLEAPASVSAGTAGADPSRAALYQSFGASLFPSGPLGTRAPRNAEDSAILLAQAALAIDAANRDARDARIANTTSGARSGIGRAIADVAAVAQAQQTAREARDKADAARTTEVGKAERIEQTLAGLDTEIATTQGELSDVSARIDDVAARIADVEAEVGRTESEEARQPLLARLSELRTRLGGLETTRADRESKLTGLETQRTLATQSLAAVRAEIARLDGVIAGLVDELAKLDGKSRESAAALMSAYSRVALQAEELRGAQRQDAVESTNLDRSLDEVSKILDDFRANALARVADTAAADRLRDDAAMRRVLETALGLAVGLAEALDVLERTAEELADAPDRPAPADPAIAGREPPMSSGPRLQLSL